MADCSELSKLITDIATNLASREGVDTLDDVLVKMKELFPAIRREDIVDAIVESTTRGKQKADELSKKINEIKREARSDKKLQQKIEKLEKNLKEGTEPLSPKQREEATFAIEQLRDTAKNLRKWANTVDPIVKKKMLEKLTELNKKIDTASYEDIPVKRVPKLHESLQGLQKQIDAAKGKLKEQKTVDALRSTIDELTAHLENETLPVKQKKESIASEAVLELRSIRDDLKKKLAQSEPAQKLKIEEQIKVLEDRLKSGDMLPKTKPESVEGSRELEKLKYQRDKLKADIQHELYKLRSKTVWEHIQEPFNVAKVIMTSGEFSLVLKQGGFNTYAHPLRTASAMKSMFEAFGNEETAFRINAELENRVNAPQYLKHKFFSKIDGSSKLSEMEEIYLSHWTFRVPIIKNFQRAGITFLNKLRADAFDTLEATATSTGSFTKPQAEVAANFINVVTGRGHLGQSSEMAINLLNDVFFAPKFAISRFQVLLGQPIWTTKGGYKETMGVRAAIVKEYARFARGLAIVFSLGIAAGGEIETDPRSSDFAQLRWGRIRLNPTLGLSQVVVLLTRLALRQTKNTETGKITDLKGREYIDVGVRFLRGKLNVIFGTGLNIASGENVVGEKTTPQSVAEDLSIPITYQNIYEVMQEEGVPKDVALSILEFLGMSVNVYNERNKQINYKPTSR